MIRLISYSTTTLWRWCTRESGIHGWFVMTQVRQEVLLNRYWLSPLQVQGPAFMRGLPVLMLLLAPRVNLGWELDMTCSLLLLLREPWLLAGSFCSLLLPRDRIFLPDACSFQRHGKACPGKCCPRQGLSLLTSESRLERLFVKARYWFFTS